MSLDGWTLALQTINVLVLLWLLSRFLFTPVARILAARRQTADALLADAREARDQAEQERRAARDANAALAERRDVALAEAEQAAQAARERLLKAAQAEAEAARAQAEQALARRQRESQARLEAQARTLAVDIARQLLERLPDEVRIAGFIDGLADGVRTLDPERRRRLAEAADRLHLTVPREPAEADLERCRAALGEALERPVALSVAVDPALLAGLELEGAGLLVRHSLRADLSRLTDALTHADHPA